MIKPISGEELYEGENVCIAYIAECELSVVDLNDLEGHIFEAMIGNNGFSHLHSCVTGRRCTITGRRWHRSDLTSDIGSRIHFFGGRANGSSWNYCLGVPREVPRLTHVSKR